MSVSRPWWASEDGTDHLDPDQDPMTAHRSARSGTGRDAGDAQSDAAAHVCGVCPLCTAARVLGDSHPEVLDHLVEAARHLAAAARRVVEPPGAPRDEAAPSDGASPHEATAPDGAPPDGAPPDGAPADGAPPDGDLHRIDLDPSD